MDNIVPLKIRSSISMSIGHISQRISNLINQVMEKEILRRPQLYPNPFNPLHWCTYAHALAVLYCVTNEMCRFTK